MSAQAPGNEQPRANDSEWLEFPDRNEISAASVWALDYEDETTIQSKRVATSQDQQETAARGDEPSGYEPRPRALILDESQVLPSEASFATVNLYHQVDSNADDVSEQPTTQSVEDSTINSTGSRTRRLDVAHILPGEVSYATVRLQIGDRPHSPLREFFATSSLDWRKLTVEALLLVSVCVAIAMVALKIAKPGVFSSNRTVNSAGASRPQTEPNVIQTELPASNSQVSAVAPTEQIQVNDQTASVPENAAKLEAAVETPNKSSVTLISEGTRKAADEEIGPKIPHTTPQQEGRSRARNLVSVVDGSKPGLTTQPLRSSVKKYEAGNTATPNERVGVNNRPSKIVEARGESSSNSTNATSGQPKAPATSPPITGGGQRPRTVTPKVTP